MNSKNQKEKPNYALYYRAKFRDDSLTNNYLFNAPNDNKACELALSFIEKHNKQDKKEIDEGRKSWQDWCLYKPIKLERIAYVIKEVEERTPISLQEDVAFRVRNGALVELTELANS